MKLRGTLLLLTALAAPFPAHAQSVVVDEGTFSVTIHGRNAGTETFAIRRSGLGNEGTILAHGTVTLTLEDGSREVRPILEAVPTDGTTTRYQVTVSGAEDLEASLALAGNRYVSEYRSPAGEEEREFLARPATHVLDVMVAHQYYFLRSVSEGVTAYVIEPRTRRALGLDASRWEQDEIQLARNRVAARRVVFGAGDDARTVWYDGQGRVLKVEVPALGYVAERQDVVG